MSVSASRSHTFSETEDWLCFFCSQCVSSDRSLEVFAWSWRNFNTLYSASLPLAICAQATFHTQLSSLPYRGQKLSVKRAQAEASRICPQLDSQAWSCASWLVHCLGCRFWEWLLRALGRSLASCQRVYCQRSLPRARATRARHSKQSSQLQAEFQTGTVDTASLSRQGGLCPMGTVLLWNSFEWFYPHLLCPMRSLGNSERQRWNHHLEVALPVLGFHVAPKPRIYFFALRCCREPKSWSTHSYQADIVLSSQYHLQVW